MLGGGGDITWIYRDSLFLALKMQASMEKS